MKLAFLSDIHGNAVALDAVLNDIYKLDVDQIICLGDISFRGPEPERALQLIRSLDAHVIKGNADEWLVRGVLAGEVPAPMLEMMNREREWAVARLNQEDLNYLEQLPTNLQLHLPEGLTIHAFHATPSSLFEVVLPDQADQSMQQKLMSAEQADLYIYAHIHLPFIRFFQGQCLVNLGSVGLPFDGLPQASYALVEVEQGRFQVSIRRVAYDVERVVRQYTERDYPNFEVMSRVVRQAVSPFK